jgi:hypothetical protein
MSTHISRISSLESALSKLESSAATKKQVDSLRGEYTKLLESEHLEVLNLRAHVWGIGPSAVVSALVRSTRAKADLSQCGTHRTRLAELDEAGHVGAHLRHTQRVECPAAGGAKRRHL